MNYIYSYSKKYLGLIMLLANLFFCTFYAKAQCSNIDFSANYTKGCLPTLVKFTATGAPAGSTYYWDFGYGNVTGGSMMLETYTNPGKYDVKLEVRFPNGTICTKAKTNYLNFTTVSEPKFGTNDTQVCSKPPVSVLVDSTLNVSRREWYIDGSLIADTGKIISHTFTSPGYKTVTLKVFDINGCSKVLSKNNYIYVHEEYAVSFCTKMFEDKSRSTIKANFTPFVDPKATNIIEYLWEFPGGSPSTYKGLTPPTVTYSSYNVPLDVTFSIKMKSGCIAKFTKKGLIRQYYSVPTYSYCASQTAPLTVPPYQDFTFKKITSDKKITVRAAKDNVYNIRFLEDGDFDIKIAFAYPNATCIDTIILEKLFAIQPPLADFSIDNPTQCFLPATINMKALSDKPSSGTNKYFWEITDSLKKHVSGSPYTTNGTSTTSYTFYDEGIFSVRLTVINSEGCAASVIKNGAVRIVVPNPNIVFPVNEICVGQRIKPLNYSSPKAGNSGFTHSWKLTNTDSTNIIIKATGRTPNFSFKVPGIYDVEYTIANGTDTNCRVIKTYAKAITVNGIIADFTTGKKAGCLPFITSLKPIIKLNKPNTSPGNTLSYLWKSTATDGIVFSDSTAAEPVVTLTKNGCFTIILTITNAYGCSTVVTKRDYLCNGTIANFTMQSEGCKNVPVKIVNTSKLNPNYYRWRVEPSANVTISPSATDKNPTFIFPENGCYTVKLFTGKKADVACEDSITKSICIRAPIAGFTSNDTSKKCAPVLVQFTSTSKNADSFFWDFGDGYTLLTNDSTPIHFYESNNPDGFTVKMTAIRKYGCRDSVTMKNFIKVYGPVPGFAVDKDKGCQSLTVNFTNTSKYISEYYMIYGDNSNIDSNVMRPHTYKYFDYSLDSNVFYPTIYSKDTTGCISAFKKKIVVYPPPAVAFTVTSPAVCTNRPVQFINNTKYAEKYEWDFNNDGIIDDTNKNPAVVFNETGWRTITLTGISKTGCKTTLKKDSTFLVNESPVSKFTASKTKACAKDTIFFTYTGTSNVAITSYHWEFSDGPLRSDTSNLKNPFYHYKNPGNHKVTLTIFNQNGCSDTFSTFIYTPDTIPPVRPEIYYVTVTPNNTIQIVYNTANNSDFAKYHVKQLAVGPATEIFTSSKITDTIAVSTNSNVFAQSYCFTTQVEDDCGLISQPSLAHCSIHLDVIPNSSIANRLDWTGYQGWAAVSAYEIYRKIDQGSFSLLATASESARSYIDSNLCDKMYTYYIKALHPNGRFVSTSNLDSLKPDYIYQNVPLDMYKTTVVADAFTYTAWRPSEQVNVRMYVIDKYTENIGWQPAYRTTTNNYITDNNVNVQTTSYKYQVRVIDNCGNISPLSNPATSIVLNSTVTNDKRYLSWNKYYLWNAGVKEYLVQLQDNNKNFQTIAKVPQTDSQYVDDSAHTDVDEATCYRIVALENAAGRDQDTSISNMRCAILPARIFIPNAFTPNADGHNEVFKLEALSIHKLTQSKDLQFTFRIFNRWGELLFETHDVNAGWDGRFNGEPSPLGVYAYTVEAHGLEGSRLFLNGTFTLLK